MCHCRATRNGCSSLAVGTVDWSVGGGAGVAADAAPADRWTRTLARIDPSRDRDDSWTISRPFLVVALGPRFDYTPASTGSRAVLCLHSPSLALMDLPSR